MSVKSKSPAVYIDLKNNAYALSDLDDESRVLIAEFQRLAATAPDWGDFTNAWMPRVSKLLSERGFDRRQMVESDLWRIVQDIGARLHIASGLAQAPDYRDELAALIRTRFKTRREFCQLTGLSEDLLSHVLAHRKHLSIDSLTAALAKIGYGLHIAPLPQAGI